MPNPSLTPDRLMIIVLSIVLPPIAGGGPAPPTKKADAVEHPEVCDHVGLLGNEPPAPGGLPFLSSSDDIRPDCFGS